MRGILLILLACAPVWAFGQTIPSDRVVDWSRAGLTAPIPPVAQWVSVADFGATGSGTVDESSAVNAAIASLNGHSGGIWFPPGTYLLEHHIRLHDSVIVRGAGATETVLQFDHDTAGFGAYGTTTGNFVAINAGYQKDSEWISVSDASQFSAGGWCELQQDNGGWYAPAIQEDWADSAIGQILSIAAISGDTLFLGSPLRTTFNPALNASVQAVFPVRNISIECLKLQHLDSNYASAFPNIDFQYCAESRVAGIESAYSCAPHVSLRMCSNVEVTGCYIHHAWHYSGAGRRGYGVTLDRHTGECLIENNAFQHLRHSMMVKVGANGNVFAYNYSTEPNRSEIIPEFSGDFSMHGHWPFANLFEGNIVENIILDHFWGPTGEHNTLFRNLVEMYGIVFTESDNTGLQTHTQNVVGNVITKAHDDPADADLLAPFFTLYYGLLGNDHFEYANQLDGTIVPANTTALTEVSLYAGGIPAFWPQSLTFPPIGLPNTTTQGTLPAKERFEAGEDQTVCPDVEPAVGLPAVEPINTLLAFPNPAADWVQISGANGPVQFIDLLGHVWLALPATAAAQRINISHLPAGIYLIGSQNPNATGCARIVIH